jgi:chromosome segregation ATPase
MKDLLSALIDTLV